MSRIGMHAGSVVLAGGKLQPTSPESQEPANFPPDPAGALLCSRPPRLFLRNEGLCFGEVGESFRGKALSC